MIDKRERSANEHSAAGGVISGELAGNTGGKTMPIKAILTWSTVLSGAVTAWLWWKSTQVKITEEEEDAAAEANGEWGKPAKLATSDGVSVWATQALQARWNTRAAAASGVTAALQALTSLWPETP